MKNKLFAFLFIVMIGLILVGCDHEDNPLENPENPPSEIDPNAPTIEITGKLFGNVGEIVHLTATLEPADDSVIILWKSENPEIAEVDIFGKVTCKSKGVAVLIAYDLDNENVKKSIEFTVRDGDPEYTVDKIIVNPTFSNRAKGEEMVYDNETYYYGFNAFSSVSNAMDAVKKGSKVYLLGTYDKQIIISKNDIYIYGDKNYQTKITGPLYVNSGVSNITIEGLSFTEKGTLELFGDNNEIVVQNNKIYDTTSYDVPWSATESGQIAVFNVKQKTACSDNITFTNNTFENVREIAINICNVNNLKITNNTFDTFYKDAIHTDLGAVAQSGQWLVKGNTFKNGQYNAIFFNSYGSDMDGIELVISVYENTFEKIGIQDVDYCSCITTSNFQSSSVTFSISYNTFKNSRCYISFMDGIDEEKQWLMSAFINFNSFIGLPEDYYIYNAPGKEGSLFNVEYNFYANEKEESITLTDHMNQFVGCNPNKNVLTSKSTLDAYLPVYGKNSFGLESTSTLVTNEKNVTFTSSNPAVATVNDKGVVTAVSKGIVEITATSNQKTGKIVMQVTDQIYVNYAARLIQVAEKELGYLEGTNGYTKFGDWYGEEFGSAFAYGDWCAMFVSWCADQAGVSQRVVPKYALVSNGMNWFVARGRFEYKESGYKPKLGDIIFFLSNGAGHTGMVIKTEGDRVYTIEGNTSDTVAKRNYSLDYNKSTGYGVPDYPKYEGNEQFQFDVSDSTEGAGHSTT